MSGRAIPIDCEHVAELIPLQGLIVSAFAVLLSLACGLAHALTQDEVAAGAAKLYQERIAALARADMLDRDRAFMVRIERIVQRLSAQAMRDAPQAPALAWEVHASDDSDDNASCMAGGKLLISQAFVERLGLTDAELAMVLSHEMQHAILRHNLKEYEEALRLDPSWLAKPFSQLEYAVDNDDRLMAKLSTINFEQEVEADRAGMVMAWRAGWRGAALAGYFRKMEQVSSASHLGSATHPAPLQRWRAARSLAQVLDRSAAGSP